MISSDLDFSALNQVMRELKRMSGRFDSELAKAVNEGGKELYDNSVYAIAEYYHIPPEAVKYGIDRRYATPRDTEFDMIGEGGEVPYVIWYTNRDESVCDICGPGDGQVFSVDDAQSIWPAHPNCRCTLEPVSIPSAMFDSAEETLPPALEIATLEALEAFANLFGSINK